MNEPKPTRPVADDLNVATSFARGVTLTKTRYDDEYRGEPDACVAAGLIKYDQVPGRPGFNKTSATFFDGKLVARGGSCHPHNEKYVRVLLIGKKIEVSIGLADAVRIERSKIEDAKSQIRREAQQKVLLATRAAESELGVSGCLNPHISGDGKWRRKLVAESGGHLWCRILVANSGACGVTNR